MGSGLVSPWHIAILALVVLLAFGPKKLPEIGRSLGRGISEFKGGVSQDENADEQPQAPALPAPGHRERDTI